MVSATPSLDDILERHQIIYDIYFSQADATGSGFIGAYDANNFLKLSKLSADILKDIWDLSDPTGKGYLDRYGFYLCLKLVSLAQSNQAVKIENLALPTPAPKLGELSSNITSLINHDDPWYIKASSRIAFDKTFDSLSPISNKLAGSRVKPFLLKSGLSVDILGKIWELSDLDQDGQLDRDEFLISSQLIQKAKDGMTIPDQLPPSLLPFKIRHSPSNTVVNSPHDGSLINEAQTWVVNVDEKTKSDVIFNQIDSDNDGYVNGNECKDVFLKTGLSPNILANIWALCDIGFTGRLNHEQFALAMHFVNKKLSTGLDPPVELLPEMVPPSLRPKPVQIEETHGSKEFEELQTQVTELQREKLFYEQRAGEHESQTRQKRTELTNLELEMESIYKTIQERELNKIEENKKFGDLEDKLAKLANQLSDLKSKFEQENFEINQLRSNIVQMNQAQFKSQDLPEIKRTIQALQHEQVSLEQKKLSNLKTLSDLNSDIAENQTQVDLNRSKITLLKKLESNLNKLTKEYDMCGSMNEVSEEITKLEAENKQLEMEITKPGEIEDPFKTQDPFTAKDIFTDPFNSTSADVSNPFPDDPFSGNENPDPFTQAFDPFKVESKPKISAPPPRPAPPRPQTPSLKPTKKPTDFTQRPQSAMDFTNSALSAAKMDLFNNFDPFAPGPNKSDPFGTFDWASTGTNGPKQKDPFDPFA